MLSHRIPYITPDMYRNLPDQTTEILNRLIDEANERDAYLIEITNEIIAIKRQLAGDGPTPPSPTGEWQQILTFYPGDMGTAEGLCLVNVMDGFHIPVWDSHIGSAYEDMLWNKNNGTLHEELYPPADIAVPIYIRTIGPYHHIVAWDHGVVYDDKVRRDNWVDYFGAQNIWGWGEYCDGVRVVAPIS